QTHVCALTGSGPEYVDKPLLTLVRPDARLLARLLLPNADLLSRGYGLRATTGSEVYSKNAQGRLIQLTELGLRHRWGDPALYPNGRPGTRAELSPGCAAKKLPTRYRRELRAGQRVQPYKDG